MAYEMVMPYHLHMPSYFLETFTEYPFKDYGKAKIYCPPLAEQKHIANVLDKLESKLLLEQGILASFNWQKRYLLGQMLI